MPLSQVSKRTEELPRVALNVVSHLRRKGCVVWSEAAVEQALYSSLLYRGTTQIPTMNGRCVLTSMLMT